MHTIKAFVLFSSIVALAGCGAEVDSDFQADLEQTDVQAQALQSSTRFVVDLIEDDGFEGRIQGSCVANQSSAGKCNLRAALSSAQNVQGKVVIELAVDPVITNGQINVVGSDITIQPAGSAARRSITGSANSRLFQIAASSKLTLFKLSIQNFSVFDVGGAISNAGNLQLRQVMLANNKADCSGGGAMTAFATCAGGAIWNTGTLNVSEGTRFESNRVTAYAYTAAFTNASAGGGAISSTGSVVIFPPVAFVSNTSVATAQSGYRPNMPGGAFANSGGGAISSSGTLTLKNGAPGSCEFLVNSAQATAEAIAPATGQAQSYGGAISHAGNLQLPTACVFFHNSAAVDPNVHLSSTSP